MVSSHYETVHKELTDVTECCEPYKRNRKVRFSDDEPKVASFEVEEESAPDDQEVSLLSEDELLIKDYKILEDTTATLDELTAFVFIFAFCLFINMWIMFFGAGL